MNTRAHILCFVMLVLVVAPAAFAEGKLVVKSNNSGNTIVIKEQESAVVETLLCDAKVCSPVKVAVTQFLDRLRVEPAANVEGKYVISKMTNAALEQNLEETVTFTYAQNGTVQEVQKRVQVKQVRKQVQQKKTKRLVSYTKAKKLQQQRLARAAWLRKYRQRKRAQQLRAQQARQMQPLRKTTEPKKLDVVSERKSISSKSEVQSKPTPPTPETPPKAGNDNATDGIVQPEGNLPPAIGVGAGGKNSWTNGLDADQMLFLEYVGAPTLALIILSYLGIITYGAARLRKIWIIMLLSALPFGVVGILFQYDFPVPSHPTVLLLSFIATVLGSYCLVVHAIFKLLIRRSIEKHNSLNKKQKLLAREKHWLFPLAILQVVLFPLQRLVKSWKQDPHTLQGGACDADRWNTGSLAFTAAVIILLALFAAYEASGQSKFVAVTFTAEQEVVANPEKGLVATYIITYNKELFNDNTSFQAKPGFTIRPKGGDYYARNAGWQLGDDMIEFANKHQLHILNSGGRKIEIWTFKNYTEEEWVEIVDAVNKIIGKAFAIKQFIPN